MPRPCMTLCRTIDEGAIRGDEQRRSVGVLSDQVMKSFFVPLPGDGAPRSTMETRFGVLVTEHQIGFS